MEVFTEYLETIVDTKQRERMEDILEWILQSFPNLVPKIAWNQPMFTNHDTFIIGFSVAKNHIAIAPEIKGINQFSDEIKESGYKHTKQLFQIPWDKTIDYSLIQRIIEFNITDKIDCQTFWRK